MGYGIWRLFDEDERRTAGYGLQTNRFLGVSDGGSVSAKKFPSMANGGSR
jgi:hypothetical protein